MILSFAILFSFLFLGEFISNILQLSVPGNVIGMVLLTASLCLGWIKDDWVKPAAKLLLDNMA
ncbi:MAG: CidA/LrgA family protein, partial [Lentisphaeria bacterium]